MFFTRNDFFFEHDCMHFLKKIMKINKSINYFTKKNNICILCTVWAWWGMLGHGGMGLGGLGWGMDPVWTDFVSARVCFRVLRDTFWVGFGVWRGKI